MINNRRIVDFLKKWENELPSAEILYDYAPICRNLLYEKEDLVLEVTELLKNNIKLWAKYYSKIYKKNFDKILTKEKLLNKNPWYVNYIRDQATQMTTSGSTTGTSFHYLRWDAFFNFIEGYNHYDLVLDEFKMPKEINLLFLLSNNYEKNKIIFQERALNNLIERHGLERKVNVHIVNDKLLKNKPKKVFEYLFKNYLNKYKFDVILSSGPNINLMCNYLKKTNYKDKICDLLSSTNETLLTEDVNFLFSNKYADDICDHMRCWDGGASFFTCKYKTYHLMDNLSWCEEIDKKLISTDYFSLPSPFINYWNGDYCEIENKYQRCECGRLYRNFKFLENRPFSMKGSKIREIQEQIKLLNIPGIKHVVCNINKLKIISNIKISEENKIKIKNLSDKFKFKFEDL